MTTDKAPLPRKARVFILGAMIAGSAKNAAFLLGDWHVFFGVIIGQLWAGQSVFSYMTEKHTLPLVFAYR